MIISRYFKRTFTFLDNICVIKARMLCKVTMIMHKYLMSVTWNLISTFIRPINRRRQMIWEAEIPARLEYQRVNTSKKKEKFEFFKNSQIMESKVICLDIYYVLCIIFYTCKFTFVSMNANIVYISHFYYIKNYFISFKEFNM